MGEDSLKESNLHVLAFVLGEILLWTREDEDFAIVQDLVGYLRFIAEIQKGTR